MPFCFSFPTIILPPRSRSHGRVRECIDPLLRSGLKPLICKGFKPSNCPRWQLCACVRSQSFAGGERQQRSRSNTFLDWSEAGTTPRTGSSACFLFCKAKPFPTCCPTAGRRHESICRPATLKCFGHRHKAPGRHPATGSSHHRCYSICGPALELSGIACSSYVILYQTINSPLEQKRTACFSVQTVPSAFYAISCCFFFSLARLAFSR